MGPNRSVSSLAPGGYFKLRFLQISWNDDVSSSSFFFFFPSSMELAPVESTGTLRTGLGHSSRSRIQGGSPARRGQSCMDGNPRVKSGGTNGNPRSVLVRRVVLG